MPDRVQLKQEARGILNVARVSPYLFTFLLMGLLAAINGLDAFVSGSYAETLRMYMPREAIPAELLRAPAVPAVISTFVGVLVMLVGAVLRAGYSLYHLGIRDGRTMPYSTVWSCFSIAGRVILLAVVETVLITLWFMLFILPGIIAAYRYRFAVLNLLEDPELGVWDALRMSKAQTYGYKLDLFLLDLSFLGWMILCLLTFGVLYVWIGPYISQTNVCAFRAVKRATGVGSFPEEPSDVPPDGGFSV